MAIKEIQKGSLKELWSVSSALMISLLSLFAMIFCDRIFLSYYSISSLQAATSAGTLCWALGEGWLVLAATAEIFVAQYNGAKQHRSLGEPVWQMIYLSGLSLIFFGVLATYGSQYFHRIGFMNEQEMTYFRWVSCIIPLSMTLISTSSFYIGQGKTRLVKYLGLLGNGVNIALDPLLIFGVKGWIPSLGIKGAAIATAIGQGVQVIIILVLFLSRDNRIQFGTGRALFNKAACFKCLKIGLPSALLNTLEMLGWTMFYFLMKWIGPQHFFVSSVIQSILLLLFFFPQGLSKGVGAITGNLIGAKKWSEVIRALKSGLILALLFGIGLSLFLIVYPHPILHLFCHSSTLSDHNLQLLDIVMSPETLRSLKIAMVILTFYLILETVRWLLSGILTAAGDTLFLMVAGSCSVWLFLLLPTYLIIVKATPPIELCFGVWIFYSVASTTLYFLRFSQGKWKKKQLIDSPS